MQYIRHAGSDPSFLLKALGEASGELRRSLMMLPRRELLAPGAGVDEGWRLMAVAVHLRDVERGVLGQIETIARGRGRDPEIKHVGLEDFPLDEDVLDEDEDEVLRAFHYYRQHTAYTLWDLSERAWEWGGMHPYRGRLTILEITRELYRHDLEHLWQVRRMLETP